MLLRNIGFTEAVGKKDTVISPSLSLIAQMAGSIILAFILNRIGFNLWKRKTNPRKASIYSLISTTIFILIVSPYTVGFLHGVLYYVPWLLFWSSIDFFTKKGETDVHGARILNEEGIDIQPNLNEKPIRNITGAPQKDKTRDKRDNNCLVKILSIVGAAFGLYIGRKYPALMVSVALIALIASATYYCFKPINILASDYKKKRGFSFLFSFLVGITLPVISGGLGIILSFFGLIEYLTQGLVAIIQGALLLFYWVLLGPIIVKRNLPIISTLLTGWIVFIIAITSLIYLIGRLSVNYLMGIPIFFVICNVLFIASVWFSKRYVVRIK